MIFLRLFLEFFKVGLFSVGGGLATIPFLADLGVKTGWFSGVELANMIAVSESTPGPMGVNMATYVGYATAGLWGAVVATLGLVTPSVLVILLVARFLQTFRQSRVVDAVFYGLRPASTALIATAGISVAVIALLHPAVGGQAVLLNGKALGLAVVVFACLRVKPLQKLHPVALIAGSAVAGILLQL